MKKRIAFFLALVCLLTAMTGCGGKKEMDASALVNDLLSGAKFMDSLDRVSDGVVPVLYAVDTADYVKATLYCGTAATAEEIAVFEAVDGAAASRILKAAQDRVAHQIETYKDYGPAQAMMLGDAIVKQSGNYVVVVVCTDADGAAKIVDNYI